MPCPAGSTPSAARCASWSTPPTRRLPRPSSAPTRPCFVLEGCILLRRGIVPGSEGIIAGGHASKTGCTVAIRYGEAVTAPVLIAMFRLIITNDRVANDRVGGWRELKRQADPR
jgi:hypothetical protein